MVSKEPTKNIKEIVKKYQGKYYLGYEINNSKTYLFVKKVCMKENQSEKCFLTFSDIIYSSSDEYVEFDQNKEWYFGINYIENWKYKEISKSLFMSVVNKFGFRRLEKNSKEFHTNRVKADYR